MSVIKTSDFSLIEQSLKEAPEGSMVFLDIDNNIIMPKSRMFRGASEHKYFIEEIKKNRDTLPNFVNILANWRTQRQIMLIHEEWPTLVNHIKSKNIAVYALTLMPTGAFGHMEKIEDWRYKELKEFGIEFVEQFLGDDEFFLPELDAPHSVNEKAVFYRGFFMTGAYTKGNVMRYVLNRVKPSKVFFVDDREDMVLDVEKACAEFDIPYTGIIFSGWDLIEGEPDPEVIEIQKYHLLEHAKWLEDHEAEELKKK